MYFHTQLQNKKQLFLTDRETRVRRVLKVETVNFQRESFSRGGLKGRGLNGERNIWDTGGGSRCRKHKIHEGIILFTGWVVFHAGEIYGKMEQRS